VSNAFEFEITACHKCHDATIDKDVVLNWRELDLSEKKFFESFAGTVRMESLRRGAVSRIVIRKKSRNAF
jgi:hypothetical protein